MIQRLFTTLRALAALPTPALASESCRSLRADAADAIRLTLDCPQHDLTAGQRAALRELSDALEDAPVCARELGAAVQVACGVLAVRVGSA